VSKKFILAADSFKESMTAKEVCDALETGITQVFPDAEIVKVPMADGGEGTVQALVDATNGMIISKTVTGPSGTPVEAHYGILGDGKTAIIEMSSASGIQHVSQELRNPLHATTYGTGELISDCLDKNIYNIIIGIGGSATNDGGSGMAAALGVRFLDKQGQIIEQGGGNLDKLDHIDLSNINPKLEKCFIEIASDVTNALCGENGASAVFGPQKGAVPAMVKVLDDNLRHYSEIIKQDLGKDITNIPGAGAAGGLGAGLLAFCNCSMGKGVEIVIKYTGLEQKLQGADYCFTGEGQIDFQTKFGKTPYGVAKTAKKVNQKIKVIAIAGSVGNDIESLYFEGFDAIFSITPGPSKLEDLLRNGQENIIRTSGNIARLLKE